MPDPFPPYNPPPGFGNGFGYGHGPYFHPPANPFRVFYMLTGVTFVAFVTGFSSCLFDLSQVKECVDHAEYGVQILKKMGDHIVLWAAQILREILSRSGF